MTKEHLYRVGKKLDNENACNFKREMMDLLDKNINCVHLDFSDVELVESSGLAKLLFFSEKFSEKGGFFKIVRVKNRDVEQLFRLLNLNKFIEIEY